MKDYKTNQASDPRETGEPASSPESPQAPRDLTELPVSNWDDYKSWCEKVKENWDVN